MKHSACGLVPTKQRGCGGHGRRCCPEIYALATTVRELERVQDSNDDNRVGEQINDREIEGLE